jgi:hypothetical protein
MSVSDCQAAAIMAYLGHLNQGHDPIQAAQETDAEVKRLEASQPASLELYGYYLCHPSTWFDFF